MGNENLKIADCVLLDLRPNRSICYGRESGIPWKKLWVHQSD
jgi:hypothetical protein